MRLSNLEIIRTVDKNTISERILCFVDVETGIFKKKTSNEPVARSYDYGWISPSFNAKRHKKKLDKLLAEATTKDLINAVT